MENKQNLALFEGQEIRRVWHNDEWWFVIRDVVQILTDTKSVKNYIRNMRRRDEALNTVWSELTETLAVETASSTQKISCANMKGIFRIIQSVPSPKAEPFKQWLAQMGQERIEEINNPELGLERLRAIYRAKGYDEQWIEIRIKSIETRAGLTDEWRKRGVKGGEYGILTAEISKETFGMTPTQYKKYKSLTKENLRDHMNNLELIFGMLGEEATRQQAIHMDAQGFKENKMAAQKGGEYAGAARQSFEEKSGRKVSTPTNFLQQIKGSIQKRLFSGKTKET